MQTDDFSQKSVVPLQQLDQAASGQVELPPAPRGVTRVYNRIRPTNRRVVLETAGISSQVVYGSFSVVLDHYEPSQHALWTEVSLGRTDLPPTLIDLQTFQMHLEGSHGYFRIFPADDGTIDAFDYCREASQSRVQQIIDDVRATARQCAFCQKVLVDGAGGRCSKCSQVQYCNRKCQKAHWTAHKSICNMNVNLAANRPAFAPLQNTGISYEDGLRMLGQQVPEDGEPSQEVVPLCEQPDQSALDRQRDRRAEAAQYFGSIAPVPDGPYTPEFTINASAAASGAGAAAPAPESMEQ